MVGASEADGAMAVLGDGSAAGSGSAEGWCCGGTAWVMGVGWPAGVSPAKSVSWGPAWFEVETGAFEAGLGVVVGSVTGVIGLVPDDDG